MKAAIGLSFIIFIVGCSPQFKAKPITVNDLGKNSDFDDVEIGEDFPAPGEQDVIVQPNPVPVPVPVPEPTPDPSPDPEPTPDPDPDPGRDPATDIVYKIDTFFFENQRFQLAHGPALRWDGCADDFESMGGYNSDSRCGRGFFHPLFSDQMNQIFFTCVQMAAKEAGYNNPETIFINHLGSYNDRTARNSTRLSNHAYARALDIKNFILIDAEGRRTIVSTLLRDYVGAQAIFYDEFRSCWKDSMPSNCRPGNTEYKGSIGHNSSELGGNSLHNDHIHLSLPQCAG